MKHELMGWTTTLLLSLVSTTLCFAGDAAPGKAELPPQPSEEQIAAFKNSHVHPKTGVRLTYVVKFSQPPFRMPPKHGNYLGRLTATYESYLRGRIPFRVAASFNYEETSKEKPAGERKKFGAYYTPPIATYVLIKDENNKTVSYFATTAAKMCYH